MGAYFGFATMSPTMIFIGKTFFDPFPLDFWDPSPFDLWNPSPYATPDPISLAPCPLLIPRPAAASPFVGPPVDWKETPEAHVFMANLPGLRKEEVQVAVEKGNVLQISGVRTGKEQEKEKEKEEEEGETWHCVEKEQEEGKGKGKGKKKEEEEEDVTWHCVDKEQEEGKGKGKGKGKKKEEEVETWHCAERSIGNFLRRFQLPKNAKMDLASASLENGVLTVTIPKEKPKKLKINSVKISGPKENWSRS